MVITAFFLTTPPVGRMPAEFLSERMNKRDRLEA
jgi:hypothetical protein